MQNFDHIILPNGDIAEPPHAYNPDDYAQFSPNAEEDEYSPSIGKKLSTVSEDRTNEAMSESVDQRESMISLRPEAPPQPQQAYLDLRQASSNATIQSKSRVCISFIEFPAFLQFELE